MKELELAKIIGEPTPPRRPYPYLIGDLVYKEYIDVKKFIKEMMTKIPKNLDECIEELTKVLLVEKLHSGFEFKGVPEDEIVAQLHHTAGRAARNDWNLWGENELTKFFNDLGVYHADDMSGIIFTSLHRRLNDKDIKLKEQAKHYINYWKNMGCKDGDPRNKSTAESKTFIIQIKK